MVEWKVLLIRLVGAGAGLFALRPFPIFLPCSSMPISFLRQCHTQLARAGLDPSAPWTGKCVQTSFWWYDWDAIDVNDMERCARALINPSPQGLFSGVACHCTFKMRTCQPATSLLLPRLPYGRSHAWTMELSVPISWFLLFIIYFFIPV